MNTGIKEGNIKRAFLIDGNKKEEYFYNSNESILYPKKYSGEKYRLFEIEDNTYKTYKEKSAGNINSNNIKIIDKTEVKTKNAKSKYFIFDFNGGSKYGKKAESICLEISNNASISTAIKFIESKNLTEGIIKGGKKLAYWSDEQTEGSAAYTDDEATKACDNTKTLYAQYGEKVKDDNNQTEPDAGYKFVTFDFNGGEKSGTAVAAVKKQVLIGVKISDAVAKVDTTGVEKDGKGFAYWSIDNNSYAAFEESNTDNIKGDTLYAVYAISNADYIINNKGLDMTELDNKGFNLLSTLLIALYMLVISIAIYLRVSNILQKNNNIKFGKNTIYIYSFICFVMFIIGFIMFLECRYKLNKCLMWFFLILSIVVLIILYKFIKCQNECISAKIKKIIISILVILVNNFAFYYVINALDFILYRYYNIFIVPIDCSTLFISLINTLLGLFIILVSFSYIIITIFIEKQIETNILLEVDNSKYKYGTPEDLAVICEYKNKFLAVRYIAEEDKLIELNTYEYWFIDPSDCTIKEKSFKKESVINEDMQLTSEAEKDGKEFRYWSDASDSTKVYTEETITAEYLNNKVLYAQYDKPIIIEDNGQEEPDEGYKFVTFNFNGGKKDGKLVGPVKLQALIGLNLSDVVAKFDEGNFNNIVQNKTDIDQDITN